jgi:hypothetical protein
MFTRKSSSAAAAEEKADPEAARSAGSGLAKQLMDGLSHYHSNSEQRNLPGCYPNVSPEQVQCVDTIMERVQCENLDFYDDETENRTLKTLRFLRARKFDIAETMVLIRADVSWRQEDNREEIRFESADEVLQCDLQSFFQFFPTWLCGYDKQLRPVSYRQFGKFEIWNVLKLTSMDRLLRFHVWETEMALRLMREKSRDSGFNIETFTVVIDAAGWTMKLATKDAYTFIKGMASCDSNHYPERLGCLVVVNAPTALSFAWRIVSGFLDPVTQSKIHIYSRRSAWEPVLKNLINEDQIPLQYGGTAPDFNLEEALRSMNPPKKDTTELSEKSI